MGIPYRARVNERWFLNLPGFHGGAYVVAYVEDTSDCGLRHQRYHDDDCSCCPGNFEPRTILEIADCSDSIRLDFDVDSEARAAPTPCTSSTRSSPPARRSGRVSSRSSGSTTAGSARPGS